ASEDRMEILKNPKFDFLGKKVWFVSASATIVAASIFSLAYFGIPLGIDFRGGADIQLKYPAAPPIPQIRAGFEAAGFSGVSFQTIGSASENEILIRIDPRTRGTGTEAPKEEEDLAAEVLRAVRTKEELAAVQGKVDVNTAGTNELKRSIL